MSYEQHMVGKHTTRGYNMCLISGKPFFPLDPRPEEIDIRDIAHSLALQCRFGGHMNEFYSVAQHSILVSQIVPDYYKLEALLHDASEAYCGDLIRPIKKQMGAAWHDIEQRLEDAVRTKFDLPKVMSGAVKIADDIMAATERRDLLPHSPDVDWGKMPAPCEERIFPWQWKVAKHEFLLRFEELSKARAAYEEAKQ